MRECYHQKDSVLTLALGLPLSSLLDSFGVYMGVTERVEKIDTVNLTR